jgi:hypothetical protein
MNSFLASPIQIHRHNLLNFAVAFKWLILDINLGSSIVELNTELPIAFSLPLESIDIDPVCFHVHFCLASRLLIKSS